MNNSDKIAELERLRKYNATQSTTPGALIGSMMGIFILLIFFFIKNGLMNHILPWLFIFTWVPFFSVLIAFNHIAANHGKYIKLYKETFVVQTLSEFMTNLDYQWKYGFLASEVKEFSLVPVSNSFKSDDLLRGVYKDVSFRQADVESCHILKKYDSNDNESCTVTTFFNGRMFDFDMPTNHIKGMQIYSNSFEHPVTPSLQSNIVLTDNKSFDKLFTVKVDDSTDLKLLTPSLINRILDLNTRYPSLVMYFTDGKLYLGIHGCKNAFEPPTASKRKLSYLAERNHIIGDANITMDVIETLLQSSVM